MSNHQLIMMLKRLNFLLFLIMLAISSFLLSLTQGSMVIHLYQLFDTQSSLAHDIFYHIRLPRTCCAFVTGGLLALAGALMQTLLRNPLADPYILGTSGGGAVASLLLILCGLSGIALPLGTWLGSLVGIALIFLLTEKKRWHSDHLILVGIALASGFSALITLILLVSPDHLLRGMLFWLVGDLSESHIPLFEIAILAGGLLTSCLLAKELNILVRGEKEASALGIEVKQLKIKLFLLSSLLTATAVSMAGCIGFLGLIVPHLFRLLCTYDHRFLLPGCVLLGGSLLSIADTLSRTLFLPQQLPVGIVMVLIGIPVFIFLLQKKIT